MPYGTRTYGVGPYGADSGGLNAPIQDTGIPSEEAFGVGAVVLLLVVQTSGIPTAEAFGTGAQVSRTLVQNTGIPSAEAFGIGAVIGLNLVQTTGISSAETFGVGDVIQLTVVQTTGIPSEEAFGAGAAAMLLIRQLTGIPSGEAFGAGARVLVNYVPGWTVRVVRLGGGVVAEVGRHSELAFLKQLSGKGTGTITLLIEDAIEMSLLDEELVWRVFYDGLWAFSFFSSALEEKRVSVEMDRTVTFSGPGIAECLEWGTVLPPGYPAYTDRNWAWHDARAMKIWRDLFAAVQSRGTLPMVVPSFSDATDSSGAAWTDSVSMDIEPGGTLYEYLEKLSGMAEADWIMTPGFGLDVRRDYGDHKEDQIRFQIASDQVKFTRGKDRSGVRNVAYAEGSAGGIQEASNGGSIVSWGRREAYIQAGDSADAPTTAGIAAALIDQNQDERVQISFAVLPDSADRKVFYDYDVGTWIGAESDEPGITGDYRCVAIACKIDTEGNAEVELGLQSLFELKQSRLEKLQANGGGNSSVGAGLQSGITPDGVINAVVTSPGPTAPTGLTLSTGANENRVYIDASWTSVTPSGADPVVEYEAELSRDGVGTISAQRAVTAPIRFEPVEPGVSYTVRVRAISRLGRSSTFLGPSTITAGTDPTVPAQATGLIMGGAIRSITLTWNENTELDVVNGKGSYDVQIDTANTFSTPNLRGKRVGGTVISFSDLPTQVPTAYYGRVRAVDSSGNAGPWSTTATTTTQQAVGTDITPLSIDTALIANAAITNAKIANLAVDNAKISDLSAGKITAGTITAAMITLGSGGVLRAGRALAPFHYLLLDENGLRFYNNGSSQFVGGTLAMELNVVSGNAEFKGTITGASINAGTISGTTISGGSITGTTITGTTITGGTVQTAASGTRVVMSGSGSGIGIYSGQGYESQPGLLWGAYSNGSYLETTIQSPTRAGNSPALIALRDKGWGGSPNVELYSNWTWIGADRFEVHWVDQTDGFSVRKSGGNNDIRCYYIPFLGGILDVGIHGTSYQLGFVSSSIDFKSDVRLLAPAEVPHATEHSDNPVWAITPRKFKWKEGKVANAKELNTRNPEGVAGFVVEELAEVSMDLVTFGKDPVTNEEKPMGIDRHAMLAYIVDGLHHCHAGLKRRVLCEEELQATIQALAARLAVVETTPDIAAHIKKGT